MSAWERNSKLNGRTMKTAKSTPSWLQTELDYSGQGVAHFKMPVGSLKGPTTVKFNERGHAFVEMKIEEIDSEMVGDGFRLLYGDSGIIGKPNECVRLEVTSGSGVFSANENIQIGGLQSTNDTISFELIHSRFQAIDTESLVPTYWVIPLTNFVSRLTGRCKGLEDHPLRLNIFPNGEKEDWSGSDFATAENSHISAFRDGEGIGYIERVPNYLELIEQLKSGATNAEITAVMVGDADVSRNNTSEFAVSDGWLPVDLLLLLSLGNGNGVGSPWIEFRDTNGKLIQRLHLSTTTPNFANGLPTIDEVLMPTANRRRQDCLHQTIWYNSVALGHRRAKAPTKGLSTLNSIAFELAVYASQCGLLQHHARLASSCWSGSTGRGFHPLGSDERFQSCGLHLIPLS